MPAAAAAEITLRVQAIWVNNVFTRVPPLPPFACAAAANGFN